MAITKYRIPEGPTPQPVGPPYTYIPPPAPPPEPVVTNPVVINRPTPSPTIISAVIPPVSNQISLRAAKAGDPEPYVFGRCIAAGKLIAADDSWYNVFIDVLWSVGEIQEIEGQMVDNVLTPAGTGVYFGAVQHFLGTAGQAASTIMAAVKGSYDTLANKAHSVMELVAGQSLDKRVMVKGLKLYDPRSGLTAYSTNPALALGRVLTDAGYTLDATSWGLAADY